MSGVCLFAFLNFPDGGGNLLQGTTGLSGLPAVANQLDDVRAHLRIADEIRMPEAIGALPLDEHDVKTTPSLKQR